MEQDPYRPIDCALHDRLEDHATRHNTVKIVFETDLGRQQLVDRIADWYVRENVEYLRTESGTILRLDRILSVDEVTTHRL